jgi:hypothetical protein
MRGTGIGELTLQNGKIYEGNEIEKIEIRNICNKYETPIMEFWMSDILLESVKNRNYY